MFRKTVAASFVVVWSLLFGIESSQSIGLPHSQPTMAKTINVTLASLGNAIDVPDDRLKAEWCIPPLKVGASCQSVIEAVFLPRFRQETTFSKEDLKIYNLHSVFIL